MAQRSEREEQDEPEEHVRRKNLFGTRIICRIVRKQGNSAAMFNLELNIGMAYRIFGTIDLDCHFQIQTY